MSSNVKSGRFQAKFTIRDTDPMVREHRVFDIHILPGVVLIELVYKLLRAAKFELAAIQLESIAFHEPVVTSSAVDRKVSVVVDWQQDAQVGQVRVTSTPCKDDRALAAAPTTHMSCGIESARDTLDFAAVEPDHAAEDVATCYAVTRHIGIFHDSFMQCRGVVSALSSGGCIGHVRLSERAQPHAQDFVIQPILIDCSTVVSLFHLRNRVNEATLFMPVAIDRFWSAGLDAPDATVVVDAPEAYDASHDLLRQTFRLLDAHGRVVTRVSNFAAKRVRSLDSVRSLLERHLRAPETAPVEVAVRAVAAVDTHDAPSDGGGDLQAMVAAITTQIVRQTETAWSETDFSRPFFELGLDSVQLLDICEALERELCIELYPTLLFERPNVATLAEYLVMAKQARASKTQLPSVTSEPPFTVDRRPFAVAGSAPHGIEPRLLTSRWLPIPSLTSVMAPYRLGRVAALMGGSPPSPHLAAELSSVLAFVANGPTAVNDLSTALERGLDVEEVWLFEFGTRETFALIQRLIARRLVQSAFRICMVTFDGYQVHTEPLAEPDLGVWGLLQSLSREYPATRVAGLDLARGEWPLGTQSQVRQLMDRLLRATDEQRSLRAIRSERSYERRLLEVRLEAAEAQPMWRQEGVYLVVGGASGVGRELVRYLRGRYDARVVVLGRRSLQTVLDEPEALDFAGDTHLTYVSGHVENEAEVRAAVDQAIARFGALHGVVHSAMVLDDRRLAELDLITLERVLAPKVAGARAIGEATANLALDCLVFFSSIQSWVGNAQQANYAAASTSMDAIAARLQATRAYPVVTVNWGYFGNVGVVADTRYRELMARQGVYALHTERALAILDEVLAARFSQVAIVAADEAVLAELGFSRALTVTSAPSPTRPTLEALPRIAELEGALELQAQIARGTTELVDLARRRLAHLLRGHTAAAASPELQRWFEVVRPDLTAEYESSAMSEQAFRSELARVASATPGVRTLVPLLSQCVEACPKLLAGEAQPAAVVFPNGSLSLVQAVYEQNPVSAFYNRVVAETVFALSRSVSGRPVRILEVGAGTGATTGAVIETLRAHGIAFSYVYTDIWDKLVNQARDRFASLSADIQFRFLDVGVAPHMQGFNESYDIVIATNVLHATRDLHRSVRHINSLLASGGSLVLNESVQAQAYSTYTFGLLPGWWGAADWHERLANSPLASTQSWQRILRDEGFASVQARIPESSAGSQQVIVAVASGERRVTQATRTEIPAPASETSELPAGLRGTLTPLRTSGRALDSFVDPHNNTWLLLNNPPANTFTEQLLDELCATLESLQTEAVGDPHPRVVFLSHYGEYFSLGGDRSELVQYLAQGDHAAIRLFGGKAQRLLELLTSDRLLVVAVVGGTAQGGGFETLLAADLQIVKLGVRVGLPEVKSGLIPGMGGLSYLQSMIGSVATKRLVLLGDLVDAEEARQMGLVSHVVEDPYRAALDLAGDLQHLTAMLSMKRILSRATKHAMTADIEEWIQYLIQNSQAVDTRRIANSRQLLVAKSDAKDQSFPRRGVQRAAL